MNERITVPIAMFGALTLLGCVLLVSKDHLSKPTSAAAAPVVVWDVHGELDDKLVDSPVYSIAMIPVSWSRCEPEQGEFSWGALDQVLSRLTMSGKSAILRVGLFGTPRHQTIPTWVLRGTETIRFVGTVGEDVTVIPRVWDDPTCLSLYASFVRALAARYDGQVAGVQIGVGHLGHLTANATKNGATALAGNGWTPNRWITWSNDCIDLYAGAFKLSPLLLSVTSIWTRECMGDMLTPHLLAVIEHAAKRRCGFILSGLSPDGSAFAPGTPLATVVSRLGTLHHTGAAVMRDDWPLWVPPSRRGEGPTEGRDDVGFAAELKLAAAQWKAIGNCQPRMLVIEEPEMRALTLTDGWYSPSTAKVLKEWRP